MGDNSEMAGKKTSLDFDFSDISGKTTQVDSVESVKNPLQEPMKKKEVKEKAVEKPVEKDTGYVIAIPASGNRWICKDLAQCTGEEFIAWAKMYYSVVTAGPEKFQTTGNKIRAFQVIVAWHQSMLREAVRQSIN